MEILHFCVQLWQLEVWSVQLDVSIDICLWFSTESSTIRMLCHSLTTSYFIHKVQVILYCLSAHCFLCSSVSVQLKMKWCPWVPPASWGSIPPTRSRVASSGWRCWGRPYCRGQTEVPVSSFCGGVRDCQRRKRKQQFTVRKISFTEMASKSLG